MRDAEEGTAQVEQKGIVAAVSRGPVAPAQLPTALAHLSSPTRAQEALYRLTVELESQRALAYRDAATLKAGITLDAAAAQQQRRVIAWLYETLTATARRML